jgi:hypothetical protein
MKNIKSDKEKRKSITDRLTLLVGKSFEKMTKKEQDQFIIILGQFLGLLDKDGIVRKL